MTTTTTALPTEVREAVERLSRLDRLGALAAEEAADIRALLAYVTRERAMTTIPTTRALEYLTISEAARLLHRKPWPLMEAIERGELVAFRPSSEGPWLIRPADLRGRTSRVLAA